MEKISISEILIATGGKLLSGNTDAVIDSVCIDSREIKSNSLFVPIVGEHCDGHDFIKSAFESGAVVSFVQSDHQLKDICGALVEVESTVAALQDLAKYYRKKFSIPFVGVTGSVGKTTTKEMIAAVLGENLNVLKTQGNYNGQIGLPLTIFNIDRTHEAVIVEMGVSKIGEMERLADIADVDMAVITNIGLSHIENFKEIEITCREKLKMLKKDTGVYFINGDSPVLSDGVAKAGKEIVTFGINGAYNYRCENVSSNDFETNFTLVTDKYKEDIKIPCLGIHNVYNAMFAFVVGKLNGMKNSRICKGLKKYRPMSVRQNMMRTFGKTIYVDCFNASARSVDAALSVLTKIKTKKKGRRIAVLGDIAEIEGFETETYKQIAASIEKNNPDILITYGEDSGCLQDYFDGEGHHFNDREKLIEYLRHSLRFGDAVLFKASGSVKLDSVIKKAFPVAYRLLLLPHRIKSLKWLLKTV